MRDDLHKGAPLLYHWRKVIQRVACDADWKSGGRKAIEHALMKDARAILADPAVDRAVREVEAPQIPLLGPSSLIRAERENELYEPFRQHYADGLRGQDLKRAALADALAERLASNRREIIAHVATKERRCVFELASRLDQAATGLVDSVTQSVLGGERICSQRLSLDLDADIRRGID